MTVEEQGTAVTIDVDGFALAARRFEPAAPTGRPLIVTLHGGLYTGRYFDVATARAGSLVDVATLLGFPVVSFDRPSYGDSDALAAEENTFERQAELLGAAIAQVADGRGVVLVGHSIGGIIALMVAALDGGPALLGVSATGMGAVIPAGGASEQLAEAAAASGQDTIALPAEACDPVMFGPPETFDPGILDAAHATDAPAPAVELIAASKWAAQQLPQLAPRRRVSTPRSCQASGTASTTTKPRTHCTCVSWPSRTNAVRDTPESLESPRAGRRASTRCARDGTLVDRRGERLDER